MLLVEIAITNSTDSTNHQMNGNSPRNQFSNAVRSTVPRPILIMMRPTNCQRVAVLEETDVMPPHRTGSGWRATPSRQTKTNHAQP